MLPQKSTKKELQAFLGILSCLSKFPPVTAEVREPLMRLRSKKKHRHGTENTRTYSIESKHSSKKMNIKFYGEIRLLFLQTDASRIGQGTELLQIRDSMDCPMMSHWILSYCDQMQLSVRWYIVRHVFLHGQ